MRTMVTPFILTDGTKLPYINKIPSSRYVAGGGVLVRMSRVMVTHPVSSNMMDDDKRPRRLCVLLWTVGCGAVVKN
jgi:hypothetical protein